MNVAAAWPSIVRLPHSGTRRGTVLFFHGIGLGVEHFADLYPQLTSRGYDVVTATLPGHGPASAPLSVSLCADIEAAVIPLYDAVAHERPLLFAAGALGGFCAAVLREYTKA